MIEVKMSFASAAEAMAFLAGRTVGTSLPGTAAAAPDAVEAPKAEAPKVGRPPKAATSSAAPAATASAAPESKPAEAPAPAPTPAPAAPEAPKLDYATSDIPGRIAAMVEAGRKPEIVSLLAKFGVKRGPEIEAQKLPAFSADLRALESAPGEESLG